ncbi:MAG: SDR family NAD(P)-dependent oxidoreductase [Acidimicrobiales bacterium]
MSGRFEGRVALVTGAGGAGIGSATVRRLAGEGASVVVTDVHERRTAEITRAMVDQGATAVGLPLDIADRGRVFEVVAEVERRLGPVDVLVNNAAVNPLGPVQEMEPSDWDRVLAVDLTGAFNLIRATLPGMIGRRIGSIVNISSVAAWLGGGSSEGPYAAAKAALQSLTRTVAGEGGPYGVRCNAIAPGYVWSKFVEKHADRFAAEVGRIPLRRFGQPDEVAAVVAFLVSEESSYLTGETISLSGGWYMHP